MPSEPWTVITGGGSGIGLALAERALTRGPVVTVGRRPMEQLQRLSELQRRSPARLEHVIADLSNPESTENAARSLARPIRGFIHCAARKSASHSRPIDRRAEFLELVSVHAAAGLHLVELLASHLVQGSRVVFLSSNVTNRVAAGLSTYAAAKGAVEVLTRYLAVELAPNTSVMCVAPGLVDTPMASEVFQDPSMTSAIVANTPLGRIASPSDIASLIDMLLTIDPCWATGQVLVVDGGNSLTWSTTR